MTGAAHRDNSPSEYRQLDTLLEALARVTADDPLAVERAIRGSLALLGSFDAMNVEHSALRQALDRLATLATAAVLPDGITGDIAFLRAAMGMKDQGIRDLLQRKAVPSDSTGRDPDDKRARRMYRTEDIFHPHARSRSPSDSASDAGQ
jgi:hypothetical protein